MLDKNFLTTNNCTPLTPSNGEFEYILNDRVDLETVLNLTHFVWHWLRINGLPNCGLGTYSLSNILNLQLMCFDLLLLSGWTNMPISLNSTCCAKLTCWLSLSSVSLCVPKLSKTVKKGISAII